MDPLCKKGELLAGAPKVPGTLSKFCEGAFKDSCCAAVSPNDGAGPPKKPDGFGLFTIVELELELGLNMDILGVFCLCVVRFWDDRYAKRAVKRRSRMSR